jgi:hypothetical protein
MDEANTLITTMNLSTEAEPLAVGPENKARSWLDTILVTASIDCESIEPLKTYMSITFAEMSSCNEVGIEESFEVKDLQTGSVTWLNIVATSLPSTYPELLFGRSKKS